MSTNENVNLKKHHIKDNLGEAPYSNKYGSHPPIGVELEELRKLLSLHLGTGKIYHTSAVKQMSEASGRALLRQLERVHARKEELKEGWG